MIKRIAILLLAGIFSLMPCAAAMADETALFSTFTADVLWLLDASGSMMQAPNGETLMVYTDDPTCMGGW